VTAIAFEILIGVVIDYNLGRGGGNILRLGEIRFSTHGPIFGL
jgi:hypothetical protein